MDLDETKRGFALWDGIMKAHSRLGPEYKGFVVAASRRFRRKSRALLPTLLLQHKHVVANLKRRGVWDPELQAMDEPDFSRAKAS